MPFPVLPLATQFSIEDIKLASVTGALAVAVTRVSDLSSLSKSISDCFGTVNVTLISDTDKLDNDSIIKLLDAGAAEVAVSEPQALELEQLGVPATRIVLKTSKLPESTSKYAALLISESESQISASDLKNYAEAALKKPFDQIGGVHKLYVLGAGAKFKQFAPAIPVIPTSGLTRDSTASSSSVISLGDVITSSIRSDRSDGLYTTLVVDENNTSLGLVYSSKESIHKAVETGTGVYYSRSRNEIWHKGATSGAVQSLRRIEVDCDGDCLKFVVNQEGPGFCHFNTSTCFGHNSGLSKLQNLLQDRLKSAPEGSYTARLFNDPKLLTAKIMEEAEELCEAQTKEEIAWEAADLFYFAFTKLVKSGVTLADVERNLDAKSRKISRRKGDAKPKWTKEEPKKAEQSEKRTEEKPKDARIEMARLDTTTCKDEEVKAVLTRPSQKSYDEIMKIVKPIVDNVRANGDKALLEYTAKFEKAELNSPVLKAPFDPKLMEITQELKDAIDVSFSNIEKFHAAQISSKPLVVETTEGVICSRFNRPVDKVGLYVPGGTAVLPSTALMLGVPAMVAGCKEIIFASPPRPDGTLTPEIVYIAHKVGASRIVLAGGAQAVAALAYGTESVPKVDKVFGPGNQFVTAAKMFVQNDSRAIVSIDLPAGPSEVLVVADKTANPAFVASDLLSQAEHGVDSQVILIAVDLNDNELKAIEDELHSQAMALPRVDIIRGSIAHSTTLQVKSIEDAIELSNEYAPEHLILQINDASSYVPLVRHAGSIFVGSWSPESCGDYSSGTNHTLPTYGYARSYSGVNTLNFMKSITSQELRPEGLKNIGQAVMSLAAKEGLDAHRMAVKIRLDAMNN